MAAKFLHPFLFCNDINLKTLINVCIYDDEHLLITCKAYIKRFNVSERKQVNSWLTKSWHPFTCGAVKNPHSDYIYAVTNNLSIWTWPVDEDIENAKKYGFTSEIKELVPCKKSVYIIYYCGFAESISSALSKHKEKKKQILKTGEEILESQVFEQTKQVVLLVQNKKKETFLYRHKIGSYAEPVRISIELKNCSLTGSSIFSSGNLGTIWSDGNIYNSNILDLGPTFSWGSPKGRINVLKTTSKIKILELSPSHIALQGMKTNEEGGIVVLWDAKFGVSVSSKALKMYRDPPLAWSVGTGVVVGDGGHLVYIPVSLASSTIASMFGARIGEKLNSHDECVSWIASESSEKNDIRREIPLSASQTILSNKSDKLVDLISNLGQGSTSEEIIAGIIVSSLVRRKDTCMLFECLSAFDFIPEKSLVRVLEFFIQLPEEHFMSSSAFLEESRTRSPQKAKKGKINGERKRLHTNGNIDSHVVATLDEERNIKDDAQNVKPPFSAPKARAINQVLIKPFTANELSKAMHSLDFSASLLLLDYLHFLLASGTAQISNDKNTQVPTIETASVWLSLLLDSNYHQLVMTSEVEIHRKLLTCFGDITSLRDFLEASHSIDNLVETILSMKPLPKSQNNSPYSVERLILP